MKKSAPTKKSADKVETQKEENVEQVIAEEMIIAKDQGTLMFLRHKKVFIPLSLGAFILIALPSLYFFNQYQHAQKLLKDPTAVAREEAKMLVSRVGGIMLLPKDESPTVATISDKTKLAAQPFFAMSENGDKVLIYASARKAILYRPSTNQIIEVSQVSVNDNQTPEFTANAVLGASSEAPSPSVTNETPSPTEVPESKVVILNGTNKSGLTTKASSDLTSKVKNINVVSRNNAKDKPYKSTIVVDLTNKNVKRAEEVAKAFSAKLSDLPTEEDRPSNADFLIILGEDYGN